MKLYQELGEGQTVFYSLPYDTAVERKRDIL